MIMPPADSSKDPRRTDAAATSPPLPRLSPVPVALTVQSTTSTTTSSGSSPDSSPSQLELLCDPAAAAALARILALEVGLAPADGPGGPRGYEVRVFLQSLRSRIPVPSTPVVAVPRKAAGDATPGHTRAPDVVAACGLDAFRALRDAVYYAANEGHTPGEGVARACAFCAAAVDAVVLNRAQPHRYDAWLRSPASVCRRLEQFLRDLVDRARGGDSARSPSRPRCVVQARTQTLVAQFLQLADAPRGSEAPAA